MQYGRWNISNTGSTPQYEGAVRIYLAGDLIGEVKPSSRNPLLYLRTHNGRYRQKFVAILQGAGATQGEIESILSPKE